MTFKITDIYNNDRPLSWSAISSFEYNPKQWYDRYVLKQPTIISPELEFGSYVDKRIQDDTAFLPEIIRYPVEQFEMRTVFNKVPLVGYADAYHPDIPALRDYKTGRKAWDQKRADETGQLTMYSFMLYLIHNINPKDLELYIDWMPTHYADKKIEFIQEGDIRTFKTKRSMSDVLTFGKRIQETLKEMEVYALREQSLLVDSYENW